jgi:hydroxyacylglutathione hydrolase
VRDDQAFAAGHLRGAVNVGLSGRFAEYAAAVHAPEQPVILIGNTGEAAEARLRLPESASTPSSARSPISRP